MRKFSLDRHPGFRGWGRIARNVALGSRFVRGFDARAPRRDRLHQRIEIGRAVLQRFDEKTESAHGLRDSLEIGQLGRIGVAGEPLDFCMACGQRGHRPIRAQNRQRAGHLPDQAVEACEFAAPAGIAEESVQGRFDLREIALDLGHHLRHQQALLRLARHFVEHRHIRRVGDLTVETRVQACAHRHDLRRKLRRQAGEIVDRALGEQQRGRGLERDRFGDPARVLRHPHGHRRQRGDQQREVDVAQRGGAFAQLLGLFAKAGQFVRVSRGETIPLVLGGVENLAQGAQIARMRPDVDIRLVLGRQFAIERVQAANFQHLRALHLAPGDEIQRVAQQAFGDALRALEETLHLQVDARAQALGFHAGAARAAFDERLGEADGDPPERPVLG